MMAAARPAAATAATATATALLVLVLVLLLAAAATGQQQDEVSACGITRSHIMILERGPTSKDSQHPIPTSAPCLPPAVGPRCLGGSRRSAASSGGSSPSRLPDSPGPRHHAAPAGPRSTQRRQAGARGSGGLPAGR